jgi:hypothetical protein
MVAAKDRNVERRLRLAVGLQSQAPPNAQRVDDDCARLGAQQAFDATSGVIGFAAAGCADKRQPVVKRLFRNGVRHGIPDALHLGPRHDTGSFDGVATRPVSGSMLCLARMVSGQRQRACPGSGPSDL